LQFHGPRIEASRATPLIGIDGLGRGGTLRVDGVSTLRLHQLVTVSYVPASAGSSTLDFNAYVSNAPVGTCFYADGVSNSRN
jgi:hypothetical protein